MSDPILVEVERAGFVESVHIVDVAVVDEQNRLVAGAGDPERVASFRSSAKPMQARVMLDLGWAPAKQEHLALACASHNGEPGHVDTARDILASAGVGEGSLRCPADVPFWPPAVLQANEKKRIYHNCSGKHAAMLATCASAGLPLEGYRDPDHPLQRAIRGLLATMGIDSAPLVDGCGVPTYTGSLKAFASAFRAVDGGVEGAAMRAHPWLVGGSERLDTDVMKAAPHLLVKAGAEGLACASGAGLGIALKARDGAARFRPPALMLVLQQLDLLDGVDLAPLRLHMEPPVLGGGERVGAVRARGTIVRMR